jgi:methylglyoxal synthase
MDDYIGFTIKKQKRIALIAHDSKKHEIIEWVKTHQDILKNHFLSGTGTTARLISEYTELPVKAYNSGPLGGDQQIGSRIVEGNIDFIIFFWDPLESHPHDPDVKALLRIAAVYDIPIANNRATADFLITSQYMSEEYERKVLNYNKVINRRIGEMKK